MSEPKYEDFMKIMDQMDKVEQRMKNRRLVMVSYHKWNPRYIYRSWRGKRVAAKIDSELKKLYKEAEKEKNTSTPVSKRNSK